MSMESDSDKLAADAMKQLVKSIRTTLARDMDDVVKRYINTAASQIRQEVREELASIRRRVFELETATALPANLSRRQKRLDLMKRVDALEHGMHHVPHALRRCDCTPPPTPNAGEDSVTESETETESESKWSPAAAKRKRVV